MLGLIEKLISLFLPEKYRDKRWVKAALIIILLLIALIASLSFTVDCFWSYMFPPSFNNKLQTFNILILKFERKEDVLNKKLQLEETMLDFAKKENLEVQVAYDCRSIYPADTAEAFKIAKQRNADLVIYGNYYESTSKTDIMYVLNSKYNFIQSESGSLEDRYIPSLADLRQGYLLNDVNYIIHWVFALRAYVNSDYLQAIKYMRNIKVFDKDKKIRQTVFLGRLYTDASQNQEAINSCNEILNINPRISSAYISRGFNYKMIGDTVNAMRDYYSALSLDSTDYIAHCNLAGNYYEKGFADSALYHLNKSISFKPNDVESYILRGRVFKSIHQIDLAKADFQTAISILPNNKRTTGAYYSLATLLLSEENYKESVKNFTSAIELGRKDYQAYYNRGLAYYNQREFVNAIKDFTACINMNSDFGFAFYYRSNSFALGLGLLDLAFQDKEIFFSIKSSDPKFLKFRGNEKLEVNRYEDAIKDFEEAIKFDKSLESELRPKINEIKRKLKKK